MHGLYLIWWVQERHVSPTIVASILAAGDLALLVFEVPTGWFADRCGHRASLIAGSLIQVLGMLFCWLGQGIPALVAASVLVALGDGFRSGADQALLYRTCVALDEERAFQRTEARTRAIVLIALVGLVVAGGTIVQTWGFAAGWLAETVLSAVGLAIACMMAEPPTCTNTDTGAQVLDADAARVGNAPWIARSAQPGHMTIAFRLAALVLPAALLGAAATGAAFLAQTSTSDAGTATRLVASITLAEAAGSALASRTGFVTFRGQALLAGIGGLFVVAALARPQVLLTTAVCLAFLLGVAHPLRAAAIQSAAGETVRARVASVANACDMAFKMIALPLAGQRRRSSQP